MPARVTARKFFRDGLASLFVRGCHKSTVSSDSISVVKTEGEIRRTDITDRLIKIE